MLDVLPTELPGPTLSDLAHYLTWPLRNPPWGHWQDFWLSQVLDDRLMVVIAIPLVLVLLAAPRRLFRHAIVICGLAFVGFLYGLVYLAAWILLLLALYPLSENFARESQRKDVLQVGPPLAAWLIVGGGFMATFYLRFMIDWSVITSWAIAHAPWLLPFGAQWTAASMAVLTGAATADSPLSRIAVLFDAHLIGTAYLAVRLLQYFSELKKATIPPERRSLLNFLAFLCYPFTLMQGPIERYERFQEQIDHAPERRSWSNVPYALWRIGVGLFKGLIGTLYFMPLVLGELTGPAGWRYYFDPGAVDPSGAPHYSLAFLYFGVYVHIFWLYLEFSGYCDIAVGCSRLLGYKLVENFQMPWIATSFRDFWRRWHISLSAILRDYIYIPLGGNRKHTTLNLMITFALVGIWHVPLLQLAVWGALMGFMVAVNQHWVQWVKRIDERPAHWFARVRVASNRFRPLPQMFAWAITMHCFAHSLLMFFGGPGIFRVTGELLRRLFG